MTAEWIAVVVAIVAVGITGTGTVTVTSGFRRLVADQIAAVDCRLSDVDRRVARLEGMIDTLQSVTLSDRRRPESGTTKAPPHDGSARYRTASPHTRVGSDQRLDQAPRSPRVTKRGSRLPEADPR